MAHSFGLTRPPSKNRRSSKLPNPIAFCVLSILIGLSDGKSCVQDGQCKCTFDDGSGTVDLSPIGRQDGTPLMQDQFAPDNYAYSFNPCYPFTEGTCVNAAACQYDSANNIYYNIGDSSKVTLSFDGLNIVGTYESDDGARSSTVTFQCDPNADPPTDTALGETSTTIYGFTVASKYACVPGGPDPGPGPGPSVEVSVSISVGSVLVIVFFAVLVVYLIAGVVFNKFVRHNTGKELMPNVTLWVAFPGLVKDGVMFVVSKVTRRGGYGKV
ncbi:cation-dependent mannose-6-phosphate receptor-like [Mercenaria mercenaria]|uniref:cation-dependent mannose-6-phosphate receptor-like n=1 Tax=Mercenaria mercenaria TaxID=6596 RepID=UPI001E1D77CC|nr:cation-dependent mannose-6-phosphate receptor-like [Mercenaria mercenaria]